jgi:DNA-binding NarL/FixJ family response regulator
MRLWLPAVSPDDAVVDLRDAPSTTTELATVLVVDHDDDARIAIELMLRTAGFEVIGRARTEDALIHLAGSDPIDLVLIDAVMPGMPAARILNAIAALRPGAAVGVLSAHRSEDLEQRGIDPDVMTVIRKPIDRPELLDAVRLLLGQRTAIA